MKVYRSHSSESQFENHFSESHFYNGEPLEIPNKIWEDYRKAFDTLEVLHDDLNNQFDEFNRIKYAKKEDNDFTKENK